MRESSFIFLLNAILLNKHPTSLILNFQSKDCCQNLICGHIYTSCRHTHSHRNIYILDLQLPANFLDVCTWSATIPHSKKSNKSAQFFRKKEKGNSDVICSV